MFLLLLLLLFIIIPKANHETNVFIKKLILLTFTVSYRVLSPKLKVPPSSPSVYSPPKKPNSAWRYKRQLRQTQSTMPIREATSDHFIIKEDSPSNRDTSFNHSLFPGAVESISSYDKFEKLGRRKSISNSNVFKELSTPRSQMTIENEYLTKTPSPTYSPEKFKYDVPDMQGSVSSQINSLFIPRGPVVDFPIGSDGGGGGGSIIGTYASSKDSVQGAGYQRRPRERQKSILRFQKLSLPIRFPSPTKSSFSNKENTPSLLFGHTNASSLFGSPKKSEESRYIQQQQQQAPHQQLQQQQDIVQEDEMGWEWASPDEEHQKRVLWGIKSAQVGCASDNNEVQDQGTELCDMKTIDWATSEQREDSVNTMM